MAVEMAIWRMTEAGPRQLPLLPLDLEERLEDMLAEDPGMSGMDLLVVGRQVRTGYGGYIDLLALDAAGRVHVLELKRDRTPRDVVAQTLDYGSWVQSLGFDDLEQIYLDHHDDDTDLAGAFAGRFGTSLPDVVNADQQFTIIASELDPTSGRIVEFLSESYGVPINAVFFRHFQDGDREYLARTWLLDPQQEATRKGKRRGESGTLFPGSERFEASISQTLPEGHESLRRLLEWARSIEERGFVKLSTYEGKGAKRFTLLPRLVVENVGLVTIWNDRGAYIQFWRSVFKKKAPDFIDRIEELAGTRVGQGSTTRNTSEELLEALSAAYEHAAGS